MSGANIDSLVHKLRWISGSCHNLIVAIEPPGDPDCNLDDLAALLDKVEPLVSAYMEASFGEGNGG